jgi:hypothetical protein
MEVMVYMDCTLINIMHFSLYMWYMVVMVYIDCSLINFMQLLVHPKQPPVHADQFDVPHEPLGLLYVPLMTVLTGNKFTTNQQEQQQ